MFDSEYAALGLLVANWVQDSSEPFLPACFSGVVLNRRYSDNRAFTFEIPLVNPRKTLLYT